MKSKTLNVLIILLSIVSAVVTIKFTLEIVNKMINSELGFIRTNPMHLLICLIVGGAISFFSLAKIKKIFATIGMYYIGVLICITSFYYAIVAYILRGGIEYTIIYSCIGLMMLFVTKIMANFVKLINEKNNKNPL